MKPLNILIGLVIIIGGISIVVFALMDDGTSEKSDGSEKEPIACTLDAKICSDGTAVGRNPKNNCAFDPCPQLENIMSDDESDPFSFMFSGKLEDVLSSEDKNKTRGLVSNGLSVGSVMFGFDDNEFRMDATFQNLPTPQNDDFYEGWLVRQDPFDFISTGEATYEGNGKYRNTFSSNIDYSDYDQYVLTIEPNDGDPAPAGHVLEGFVRDKL